MLVGTICTECGAIVHTGAGNNIPLSAAVAQREAQKQKHARITGHTVFQNAL